MSKTEIIHLSCHSLPQDTVDLYSQEVEIKQDAMCLGVWWSKDLSSKKSIEENIINARRAFFALGAVNVFQESCMQSLDLPQPVHNLLSNPFYYNMAVKFGFLQNP